MGESLVVYVQGGNFGWRERNALAEGQWPALPFCLVLVREAK